MFNRLTDFKSNAQKALFYCLAFTYVSMVLLLAPVHLEYRYILGVAPIPLVLSAAWFQLKNNWHENVS